MKIIVISLVSSLKRRASVQGQLAALGLEFEFLDAVDGRTSDHPLLDRYDEEKFLIHYGRPANPGELGCYASHYLAWQGCVESNEPIMVFEDDFLLKDNFTDALKICEQQIRRYGYIRLQPTRSPRPRFVKQFGDFSLVKYTKGPQALLCYALTPDTARSFINKSVTFTYPVDVFVRHFWLHKIPLYGLTPYAADGGVLSMDSNIGIRHKVKRTPCVVIRRVLHKLYARFMTQVENMKYRLKNRG